MGDVEVADFSRTLDSLHLDGTRSVGTVGLTWNSGSTVNSAYPLGKSKITSQLEKVLEDIPCIACVFG